MSRAYYNEIDPYAAEWLRTLILVDLIAPGDVDTRSIEDVTPNDLRGYTQCHFFAGIGVWSYALRLADWPDDRPVWTGSCPCQPFSAAGQGRGTDDERHLWPAWYWLISQCRPRVVFGEQVEAAVKHDWLDLVQTDLEGIGYAVGATCLPAASVGAPHIRSRLWFVGDAHWGRGGGHARALPGAQGGASGEVRGVSHCSQSASDPGLLANDDGMGLRGGRTGEAISESGPVERLGGCSDVGLLADNDGDGRGRVAPARIHGRRNEESSGESEAREADRTCRDDVVGCGALGDMDLAPGGGCERVGDQSAYSEPLQAGPWADCDWVPCRDGKARPVEPGTFPLAHGAAARVGRLRAYGNAIVPQVAAEVIKAYLEETR